MSARLAKAWTSLARAACGVGLLSSCSLIGLDDFGFTECDPAQKPACAEANAHDGIDTETACELYACDERTRHCILGPRDQDGDGAADATTCKGEVADELLDCADDDDQRAPGKGELFDGLDNDCNRLIDEGDVERRMPQDVADLLDEPSFLSVASSATTAFVAVGGVGVDGMDTLGFAITGDVIEQGNMPEHGDLRYLSVHGLGPIDPPLPGCPAANGMTDEKCSFDDVAMASFAGNLVYATISRAGCAAGKVLLGVSRSDAPFDVLLGNPQGASADETHVELGVEGTGCGEDPSTQNPPVAVPAIAVLEPVAAAADAGVPDPKPTDDDSLEALALWLEGADQPARELACTTNAPSRVAALRFRVRSAHQDDASLAAAADGTRSLLEPPNTGRSAPSLVAWNRADHAGYFVAYPTSDGIFIGFLPLATGAPDAGPVFERVSTRIDDPGAEQVALSLGGDVDAPAGVHVRLAWRSGCGADAVIESAELTFDAERETFSTSEVMRVAGAPFARGLTLQYAETGFAVDEPHGGWVVLWTEGDAEEQAARATAARIREGDHTSLGTFELASGHIDHPFLYPSDHGNVRYGLVRGMTWLSLGAITFQAAMR